MGLMKQAAEALGAIGLDSNIPLLKKSLESDPAPEVQETCDLALGRIEEQKSKSHQGQAFSKELSPFLSVDPATATLFASSVNELRWGF